ncbi:MAG: adenosylmethionine decarboxylase [Myxococcota bacterium]
MTAPMSAPSFFEGPEKKLELVVTSDHPPLRSLGESVWRDVVRAAKADVVSLVHHDACDAYLLSESSLFVFDDYCVMMTCGLTTLVDAVEKLLETIPPAAVAFLVYERKNEHLPERQPTTFHQDAKRLNALIPGRAHRFGDEHGHYVQMFHSARPFVPEATDPTLEVLMHGIDDPVASSFTSGAVEDEQALANVLGVDRILPGFHTNEYVFEPAGYSLNAVRGEEYYTVHVTPEEVGSYVSFETNYDFRHDLTGLVARVTELFQPRAFDVVTFLPEGRPELSVPRYRLGDHVEKRLGGYGVTYFQYYLPPEGPREPYELSLPSEP